MRLSEDVIEALTLSVEELFPIEEVLEGVDDFIIGLKMKLSLLHADSVSKEEVGYMLLLMAANQAYADGIADRLSDYVSEDVRAMYEAGELPEETMTRIREHMEKIKA